MQRYAGYAVCDIRIILFEKVTLFQKKQVLDYRLTNASDNLTFLNISYINFFRTILVVIECSIKISL